MKTFYFFCGTTAELIKLMPVMKEMTDRRIPFKIIASGQNDISGSELLPRCGNPEIAVTLHRGPIKQFALGLLIWFIRTLSKGLFMLRPELKNIPRGQGYLILHGDTISTVMGALLARRYGLRIIHIEAGLRSFNYLRPFPEELDRSIVSHLADIHFCPNEWALNNIKHLSGQKVNTGENTLVDSLAMVLADAISVPLADQLKGQSYFVFVNHRQENLLNEQLTRFLVDTVVLWPHGLTCVFIVHDFTRATLQRLELLEKIQAAPHVITTPRIPYSDLMKLLQGAQYLITDGGSNQEEAYYLGLPTLILRGESERIEGLGHNVVISKNDPQAIQDFISHYEQYRRPPVVPTTRPSQIIVNTLSTL